jgi:hypothetical protein
MDLTRDQRRRLALVVAGVTVLVLVGSLLVIAAVRGLLPGTADCTVAVGKRSVDLTEDEAQAAATVSARAVRLRLPLRTTSVAVADALDSSESDARLVASALTGRSRHALTCTHGGTEKEESDRLDGSGLTARAERVRRDLDVAFGRQRVGGFAPGGVNSGHKPGSAHFEGRAVDVFVRPISRGNKIRGWAIAQYLVAHAERLEIDTVIFDARIWTARRAGQGWRDYAPDISGRPRDVAAILEHRDHVHVDVAD